ncbi:MAG: hypothetical protein WCF12_11245 [Propionicimonas sp.]
MSGRGYINAEAARTFAKAGPTGRYPSTSMMPKKPPARSEWSDALAHQCILQIDADEAYETVRTAWEDAKAAAG